MLFKLNCGYHYCISYKKNVDFSPQSKSVEEQTNVFRALTTIYKKTLQYTQTPTKRQLNKVTKSRNYLLSDKISLNS